MTSRRKARVNAMICLYQYFLTKQDIEDIFENIDETVSTEDPFLPLFVPEEKIQTMLIDAIDHHELIESKINEKLNDWSFERLGYIEQAILFLAAAEMVYEVADKAIILDEAVELAKLYGDDDSYKLINGVLDQL
ncbi:MAG TPA: transcription antitermination factor NusB [Erysipelotrichaceae bacterium]|nr:transcription antitermination factor NusB [Erysipelotrichaceae bacterium]